MWVIGIVVCLGLMFGGHAVMNSDHGSHSHEGAASRERVATETPPGGAAAETGPESATQPEPGHRH